MLLIPLLVANSAVGLVIVVLMLAAGFSGNLVIIAIVIGMCGALGYFLSYLQAATFGKLFWLCGLCHIAIPVWFISTSQESDPQGTIWMRWIWSCILSLVYTASFVGGRNGMKENSTKAGHR